MSTCTAAGARDCGRLLPDLLGKLAYETHQFTQVALAPFREEPPGEPIARGVQSISHRLPLSGDDCLVNTAVGTARLALYQTDTLQFRDLPAHGGVVAADTGGKIDDPDRPEPLDPDQQWEERPVERDAGFANQPLVVNDPRRTATLFHDLFSARPIEREDDEGHLETFVRLGGVWIVLVGAPVQRVPTGDHVAFRATPEILEATAAKLQTMGREFIRARANRALYFFDYDDH